MSKPKLKFGFQCQEKHQETYRYNRELKPVVVKSINILDAAHYARLVGDNPGVDLVYRQVPNGSWRDEGDGRRWAEHLFNLVGHIPEITMVEGHNEWIHGPAHQAPGDYVRADRFMATLIDRVHELWGGRVHAVVLNASCGHFNEDIVDFFPRTLAKLQECGKCLLGLHEYDHPDSDMLGAGDHYLCGKFLRNLAGLKAAGYDRVCIAITECGVDSGVGSSVSLKNWERGPAGSGHVGFKYWGTMAWARYLNDRNLSWYLPLVQETNGVAWVTIFGCGMHGDWASFDVANTPVINGIGAIYSNWVPPEEPPEPPPEDEMDIKVIDMNYQEQSFEWAKNKYGVAFRRAEVEEGQLVWRLTELWEKTGPHALVTQVLGEDGKPMANVAVTFYWSGAPRPPDPPTTVYPHDWYDRFVWGRTNENGDVGPGMGTGAYIGEGECGPHAVWVHDPDIPSDICECLGMLAGTFHDHLDQKFKLVKAGEDNGEPPDDAPLELKEVIREDYDISALAIAYPTSVAVDTRGDGKGPGVDEDIHPVGWTHPDGTRMALVELCTDFEGTEPRTYTLRVYRMSDGASLTKIESETFPPLGAPRERVVYVYVKDEEPDEPEGPDGDLLTVVLRMDKNLAAIRKKYVGDGDEPPLPPPDTPWSGRYYNNVTLSEPPALIRDDEEINFSWGEGSPAPEVNANDFSVRWTAKKTFEARTHTFDIWTDDGFRLWVDNELIFDNWRDQPPTHYAVTKFMTAGQHDLKVEFYERGGGATCKLTII